MGDTLASELGILSNTPPILLTTLKTVPPGTNGALSLLGTAASIGGGMAMGWTMWATLSVENAACRDQTGDLLLLLLGWGAVAGGLGSLVRIWVFGFLREALIIHQHSSTRFSVRPCKGRNTQTRANAY